MERVPPIAAQSAPNRDFPLWCSSVMFLSLLSGVWHIARKLTFLVGASIVSDLIQRRF